MQVIAAGGRRALEEPPFLVPIHVILILVRSSQAKTVGASRHTGSNVGL